MTAQPQNDDFCLECRWDGLHIEEKDSKDTSGSQPLPQWDCSDHDHHAACEADEGCCDVDDCHVDCGSICDGFVDCDASTVCSAAHCDDNHCDDDHCDDDHCDDNHCDDNHCDEQHCESTEPLCFDDHCCDGITETACDFDFFNFNTSFSLDNSNLLSPTMMRNPVGETGKIADHILPVHFDPCYHQVFTTSYQAHANHCDQNVSNHLGCQDFQKDLQGMFPSQQLPTQSVVNTEDIFHMFGVCSDLSTCHDQHLTQQQTDFHCDGNTKTGQTSAALDCFHTDHRHVHSDFKNPNDLNLHIIKGPHRNQHRCRAHHHPHSHPYSPYSRQSRSSVSSHFLSSPGETPPPLDGGASSALTTPDFSVEDSELHVCKWTTNVLGVKAHCGARFADAGAMQDHLMSRHMNTVDGAKGNGYYCCWDGCHRPDEPFSQKSKLQGHFLTHSNYKNFRCSVCGKTFARQATLDRHERSHRGDKPYKCKDCGKTFTDSSELKTHSRTHSGEKPFKCTFPGCNFQTGDSSNMSSHRLTHGERKHKCSYPGCTKSFTRPDQLKRHQRTTHKQESSSTFPSPSLDHFSLAPFAVV